MGKRVKHAAPPLRQQAEARVDATADASAEILAALPLEDVRQALHELRVHQIELEMQNEELRRAQVSLDAERARYFDLYDLAPVGYCTVSERGLILEANFTAATLLGLVRSGLVRRSLSRFIAKADQDIYYLSRKNLLETGQAQTCEVRMMKPDGTLIWVHLAASIAHDAIGAPVHRIMLSDISERKRLDQVLQEKNAELESARQVADKANLAKSDFLSSMSHELRSPLNAILGFAQLMESATPAPTPVQQGRIDHILQAGWYLLELINEILDLALIESGKLLLSLEPVSLPEMLRDCQSMIEPQAQKSGIAISFPSFDGPCFVSADRTRLKQIIFNLLSNAIKYNRAGGTVSVSCCAASTARRLRISVRDSGEGLSAEQIAQLFQSFNRLGQAGGIIEGTGIGLVVSRRLADLMGCGICVESTVGVGSVFWIELDVVAAPQLLGDAGDAGDAGVAHTLLYVEDNPANLALVEQLMERRPDLRLLSATDGTRGIAMARAHQPAVILMDINLPGISGLQALQILRADPSTAHIPVLALSANAMPHDIEKGLFAGFFRYLTKPIEVNSFMKALDLALAQASEPASRG
jgi:PAS domain S-box-containing protein